jgi:hypothetical protein
VKSAVERHELLRTVFRQSGGSLCQRILGSYVPDVPVLEAEQPIPFHGDLTTRPPIQAAIVRSGGNEHTLRLSAHRILGDGASMRLLLGEIGALYASSLGQTILPLLDRAIEYADYASWERDWLTGERLSKELEFFRRELQGADFTLPTDRPRSARSERRGSRLPFELAPEVGDAVRAMAARERATVYMVLLAAFASAIGRYAGRPAVVIGSPVSRRNHRGTERMLGPFMNTLPLAIDLSEGGTLPDLVRKVKGVLLAALAHQEAPFHLVTGGATGIGEVAFVLEDPAPPELVLGELRLTRAEGAEVTARRELTLTVAAGDGDLSGTAIYDRDLFDAGTIQGIVRDFEAVLASAREGGA